MAIKIDLEKAYDRLDWDFIQWVLGSYHFFDAWISNIMNCVRISSMSVLWNGEKLESFKPTRGVRQGDPMSSYLFVMCIEQLSRMFKQLVRQGRWKPIPISSNGPMISHLMFADDMVLFAEASVEQLDLILSCLDDFAKASGQKVNLAKSSLYLSPFVDSDLASLLSSRSGIPLTADLGKYLGVPSIHGRISVSTYSSILDKMRGRLDGWKARALSKAGRLTLVQSVLNAIPIFVMQSALLPVSLCNEIEKICRNFIWHGKDMKPAVHLINWDTMSLPKRLGGLGIRNMRQMNQALLGKLCWRAYKNPQALWVRCLFNKYESGFVHWEVAKRANGSVNWKSFCYGLELLRKGIVVDVNNGMHTRFWLDDWLPVGPLWNFALKPLIELNMQVCVRYFWVPNVGWNWDILNSLLPTDVLLYFQSITLVDDMSCLDGFAWKHSSSGLYTVKSGFDTFYSEVSGSNMDWQGLWKVRVPQRIQVFLWEVAHEKIMVNVQRRKREFIDYDLCPLCGVASESVLHALRDCQHVKQIWNSLLPTNFVSPFFDILNVPLWLSANIEKVGLLANGIPWDVLFSSAVWWLWKRRNLLVFNENNDQDTIDASFIQLRAKEYVHAWRFSMQAGSGPRGRSLKYVGWKPPETGWVVVNSDGSALLSAGRASCAGCFRNNEGRWLLGFQRFLGNCGAMEAELWGIYYALVLAWDSGWKKIEVQTDSQLALDLLAGRGAGVFRVANLVRNCRDLINRSWEVKMVKIYREANAVADRLTSLTIGDDFNLKIHQWPPVTIKFLLDADRLGLSWPRLIK